MSGEGTGICEPRGDVVDDPLIVLSNRIRFEVFNEDSEDDDDDRIGGIDANESSTSLRRFCKRISADLGDSGESLYSWALIICDVVTGIVLLICVRLEVEMQTE